MALDGAFGRRLNHGGGGLVSGLRVLVEETPTELLGPFCL